MRQIGAGTYDAQREARASYWVQLEQNSYR